MATRRQRERKYARRVEHGERARSRNRAEPEFVEPRPAGEARGPRNRGIFKRKRKG